MIFRRNEILGKSFKIFKEIVTEIHKESFEVRPRAIAEDILKKKPAGITKSITEKFIRIAEGLKKRN